MPTWWRKWQVAYAGSPGNVHSEVDLRVFIYDTLQDHLVTVRFAS